MEKLKEKPHFASPIATDVEQCRLADTASKEFNWYVSFLLRLFSRLLRKYINGPIK